jgi:hypothetical protein
MHRSDFVEARYRPARLYGPGRESTVRRYGILFRSMAAFLGRPPEDAFRNPDQILAGHAQPGRPQSRRPNSLRHSTPSRPQQERCAQGPGRTRSRRFPALRQRRHSDGKRPCEGCSGKPHTAERDFGRTRPREPDYARFWQPCGLLVGYRWGRGAKRQVESARRYGSTARPHPAASRPPSPRGRGDEPPVVLIKWYDWTKWLLERVGSFPKNQRFVFGQRLADRAIGVLELLVEAAYSPRKAELLGRANRQIEVLRRLARLAKDRALLSVRQYGFACKGWTPASSPWPPLRNSPTWPPMSGGGR